MESELHKLRIDKEHKAKRDERAQWPWFVGLCVVIIAAIAMWQWRTAAAAPVVQTMRVRVTEATTQPADVKLLDAPGYVMAAHKIELASKVVGRVAWVGVEMGDKIKKDQVLVRLEDDEYRARVLQQQGQLENAQAMLAELKAGSRPQEIAAAQAHVDQAKAELTNAQISLKRLQDLASTGSISKQQIDDAEGSVRSKQAALDSQVQQLELAKVGPRQETIDAQAATVRQYEGMLAMAKLDLDWTVIKAPVDATVLERNVEVGEFVTNGFVGERGAKGYVLSIADLNDLRVELDISQNDFAKISPHQPCVIWTDAYPDRKYKGDVDLISPEANRQKATVEVRVKVFNPDYYLKPDMNATVSFLSPAKAAASAAGSPVERTIQIPAAAVRSDAVFIVENNRAQKIPITMTKAADGQVQVQKGLIGGEDLIVDPPTTLEDGAKVKAEQKR